MRKYLPRRYYSEADRALMWRVNRTWIGGKLLISGKDSAQSKVQGCCHWEATRVVIPPWAPSTKKAPFRRLF